MSKKKCLYIAWGLLWLTCLGLGLLSLPVWLSAALGLLFFLPPFLLLRLGEHRRMRKIALLSLGLSAVLIPANILSVFSGAAWGTLFHLLLMLVSVPMFLIPWWFLSLFLWACLFFAALEKRKEVP